MGCKARIPGRLTAEEKESGRKKMRQWKENWEKKKSESLTKQIVVRLLKIRKEKMKTLGKDERLAKLRKEAKRRLKWRGKVEKLTKEKVVGLLSKRKQGC